MSHSGNTRTAQVRSTDNRERWKGRSQGQKDTPTPLECSVDGTGKSWHFNHTPNEGICREQVRCAPRPLRQNVNAPAGHKFRPPRKKKTFPVLCAPPHTGHTVRSFTAGFRDQSHVRDPQRLRKQGFGLLGLLDYGSTRVVLRCVCRKIRNARRVKAPVSVSQ